LGEKRNKGNPRKGHPHLIGEIEPTVKNVDVALQKYQNLSRSVIMVSWKQIKKNLASFTDISPLDHSAKHKKSVWNNKVGIIEYRLMQIMSRSFGINI
jgi:hypothetical protein